MAKAHFTLSIEPDILAKCQTKTENLSATICFLLERWYDSEADEYEASKLRKMMAQLEQEKANRIVLEKKLEEIDKREAKRKVIRVLE
jgi:hypothetical protein